MSENEPISLEKAESLLTSDDAEAIKEWNQIHLSGRHPAEWRDSFQGDGHGLTIAGKPRTLADVVFDTVVVHGPICLQDVHCEGARFSALSGTSVRLANSVFVGCTFTGLKWKNVQIRNCTFEGCIFEKCDFSYGILRGSRISPRTQGEANEEQSELLKCVLDYSDIREATFEDVIVSGGSYRYPITDPATLLIFSKVENRPAFEGAEYAVARMSFHTLSEITYSIRSSYWQSEVSSGRRSWISRLALRMLWKIFGYDLRLQRQAVVAGCALTLLALWATWLAYTGHFPKLLAGDSSLASSEPSLPSVLGRAYYFVLSTMTTLGYGDITPPVNDWRAMLLSIVSTIVGCVLLGTLVARFVASLTWPR